MDDRSALSDFSAFVDIGVAFSVSEDFEADFSNGSGASVVPPERKIHLCQKRDLLLD